MRRNPYLLPVILFLLVLAVSSRAQQPGTVDLSFDPGSGVDIHVYSIVPLADGKSILGGRFSTVRGLHRPRIARLNEYGTGDASFNSGTGPNNDVCAVAVQADGKVLIGGRFTSINGTNRNYIARLNANGSLDTGFNPSGANNTVQSIAVQSNGKVLIGGEFTSINGVNRSYVARLNSNGSVDTTFNAFTIVGDTNYPGVYSIIVQSDGKILIGGGFTSINGTIRNYIARLNSSGSLDTSFDPGATANAVVRSIALQSDNKIIIGGAFFNAVSRNYIARLNSNGSLDTSFNPLWGANSYVFAVAVQSDGKVLLGGAFSSIGGANRNKIARLNTDGSLDTSYNPGANNIVFSLALQSGNKALVGGQFSLMNDATRHNLARLNENGTLDASFNSDAGVNRSDPNSGFIAGVRRVVPQSGGKVIIGGFFHTVNGVSRNKIARFHADGSLDLGFNPGTGPNDFVTAIATQADGKVVIGGKFDSVNGVNRQRIARLNFNGSLDLNFNPEPDAVHQVSSVALQPDGKVIVGGFFTPTNGLARLRIVRLNADGTLDPTFSIGTGGDGTFGCLALQPDGKVLVAGWFSSINGGPCKNIARLNTNGSLDDTFNIGSGANTSVKCVAVQSDGKVLLGGNFTSINGSTRNSIARLNADGTLDASFSSGVKWDVFSIAVQSNGRVIIGGFFASVHEVSRNKIARLNADGSLDTTFIPGTGATDTVHSVALQPDGNVLIGGDFAAVGGMGRWHVARLWGDPPLKLSPTRGTNQFQLAISTGPGIGYTLLTSSNLVHWTPVTNFIPTNTSFHISEPMTHGQHFYRILQQ